MKRLLGILSAFSLTVATPSLVVACGTGSRITNPKLNIDLAKQILVSISGNPDLANIDFGSMFTDEQIESVLVNMINELLSLQYSFDSTNSTLNKLGFDQYTTDNDKKIEKSFKDKYSLESRTIAENKLFEEYTKSINSTKLDYWSVNNNYNLNIQKDTVVKDFSGKEEITVSKDDDHKYIYLSENGNPTKNDIWRFTDEVGIPSDVTNDDRLPTIQQLTSEFNSNKSPFYVKVGDGFKNISSKTALYLRFQDYFETKILEDINENLLTTAYLKSTMFDIKQSGDNKKSPYINPSSAMFSKTQTLNEPSINEKWKTNVKMVWTIRFETNSESEITNINKAISGSGIVDNSSGALKDKKSLSEIYEIFKKSNITPITDNKTGYDSYFGLSGYQGLTIYNGENAVGESPIAGKAYESNVKKWNDTAGIVKYSSANFLTEDPEDTNYSDLVLVLPVYMIELLGGSGKIEPANSSELNDEVSTDPTYTIKGKTVDNKLQESKIKFSNTISNDNVYSERWNNNKNNQSLHSIDVQKLAMDSVKQEALLNEIMYGLSKDSSSTDLAKTIIYSKYLDKDQVYYAGLWDKIGTYIKSEDDKDD
ncbi:lipoprotein [Spiroplasma sp. BIUS-1]|uniref:lipoprotein n=1 Tax=Spiroplasma sp. BIUS-1 TaxID=216964 RepID=UPI001397B75E|nr:lipoprotein [Spiroplasma sp. BIUS-1]QHX36889.1 hypothetical protein SBIUS_v1c06360 [Spiroplasma sp. BIUS-1]